LSYCCFKRKILEIFSLEILRCRLFSAWKSSGAGCFQPGNPQVKAVFSLEILRCRLFSGLEILRCRRFSVWKSSGVGCSQPGNPQGLVVRSPINLTLD
jgi:hypothetical protein